MIPQLLRAPLPPGLRAVARRSRSGDLIITLNSALTPAQQRAAVREIRRTAGRHGWLPRIIVPVAAAAAARAAKHPAALAITGAGTLIGTAAAIAIMVSPGLPGLRPIQEVHRSAPVPVVAVARPHSHRRRQDGGGASVLPSARHVTLPASAPSPAASAPSPDLPGLPLPHVHARVKVQVKIPALPLPVPLPSPTVQVCLPLGLLGDGACVSAAA